jgi:MFS family permease
LSARPAEPEAHGARRTIRLTTLEAIPFAVMTGLTDPFMIPYVLALGATAFQAGLVSSVRHLVLSLAQLGAVRLLHLIGSRKRMVRGAVALQTLLLLPIALAPLLFGAWTVPLVIALFTLGSTSAALGGPAWGSLVSEQLPEGRRGAVFGRREMLVGLTAASAGLAGGLLLHLLRDRVLLGFGLLFAAAAACRAVSWRLLYGLDDRPWAEPPEVYTTFRTFLGRARHDNFVRFALAMGLFGFTVHLTVPYLTVYMLEELRFGYFTYSIVVLSGTLIGNLMIPRWGRVGDARGNRTVLRLTMAGASVLPFLWPLVPHPAWLLAMHLLGGFLWGGLNLSAVNFVRRVEPAGASPVPGVLQRHQRLRDQRGRPGRRLAARAPPAD